MNILGKEIILVSQARVEKGGEELKGGEGEVHGVLPCLHAVRLENQGEERLETSLGMDDVPELAGNGLDDVSELTVFL